MISVYKKDWEIKTSGKGTTEITQLVEEGLREANFADGLATIFLKHTSCSLILMENADPSARVDLERFLDDLVPETYPNFTHTYEGPDDMPSHIKMALTRSSENIPFAEGRLQLGTWQGLFLWEHRASSHLRKLTSTYIGN